MPPQDVPLRDPVFTPDRPSHLGSMYLHASDAHVRGSSRRMQSLYTSANPGSAPRRRSSRMTSRAGHRPAGRGGRHSARRDRRDRPGPFKPPTSPRAGPARVRHRVRSSAAPATRFPAAAGTDSPCLDPRARAASATGNHAGTGCTAPARSRPPITTGERTMRSPQARNRTRAAPGGSPPRRDSPGSSNGRHDPEDRRSEPCSVRHFRDDPVPGCRQQHSAR